MMTDPEYFQAIRGLRGVAGAGPGGPGGDLAAARHPQEARAGGARDARHHRGAHQEREAPLVSTQPAGGRAWQV